MSGENAGRQTATYSAPPGPGERVRYLTPEPDGAEYVAVCVPAFSPDTVNREE